MPRLESGQLVELAEPGGESLRCGVIAVAGRWVLLSHEAEPAPAWLAEDVYLVFFEDVHLTRLRGRVEAGKRPGDLRFVAALDDLEPRSAPRVAVRVTVGVVTQRDMIDSELIDISVGGLRVADHRAFDPGVAARVMLQLPDGPFVDADVEFGDRRWRAGGAFARWVSFREGSADAVAQWCVDHLRGKVAPPTRENA